MVSSSPRLSNISGSRRKAVVLLIFFFRVPLYRNSIEPRNKPSTVLISHPLDILVMPKGFRPICDCPLVRFYLFSSLASYLISRSLSLSLSNPTVRVRPVRVKAASPFVIRCEISSVTQRSMNRMAFRPNASPAFARTSKWLRHKDRSNYSQGSSSSRILLNNCTVV